jgi:uncharacterized protein (UPF0261 family)
MRQPVVRNVAKYANPIGFITVALTLKILPPGFPKIFVSPKVTEAGSVSSPRSRVVAPMPSVPNLAGLNRLTRCIIADADGAI